MSPIRSAVLLAFLLTGSSASAEDHPDQVTDGEQRVSLSAKPNAETLAGYRQKIAAVPGVAEVTGDKEVIFRIDPGAKLAWSAIEKALDGPTPETEVVGAPTLGFGLTVDVVFKSDQVSAEQMPAVMEKLGKYAYDELSELTYTSGTTIRLKTAPWSPQNQRGFSVTSLINPTAGATGYRGPGAPTYDRFIEDVIFVPSGG